MQAVLLFAVILVLIAAAFAIPNGMVKGKTIDDRDASVVAGAVLALGLGGLNFAFAVWFLAIGDIGVAPLAYGLLPLFAGAIGVGLARRRIVDGKRTFLSPETSMTSPMRSPMRLWLTARPKWVPRPQYRIPMSSTP